MKGEPFPLSRECSFEKRGQTKGGVKDVSYPKDKKKTALFLFRGWGGEKRALVFCVRVLGREGRWGERKNLRPCSCSEKIKGIARLWSVGARLGGISRFAGRRGGGHDSVFEGEGGELKKDGAQHARAFYDAKKTGPFTGEKKEKYRGKERVTPRSKNQSSGGGKKGKGGQKGKRSANRAKKRRSGKKKRHQGKEERGPTSPES